MSKLFIVPLLTSILLATGCNSVTPAMTGTPPTAPQPATATQSPASPKPTSSPEANPTLAASADPGQTVTTPPGFHVVYLREGDLWLWSEVQGNVLLTDTGDLSTIRLSEDGQLLAFMRGQNVWTVRMDGTDARMIARIDDEIGSLWYAPNGTLLAVSTADHIEVINLTNSTVTPIVTYPPGSDGYDPEIVWTADSSGFKTVVPPGLGEERAQFLYVFPDGNIASLAKFSMVPPSESPPFIAPDGGYVIFVTRLSDGQETLTLMDSSGAARPYGEPGENIRAFGWLPDSKHFIYTAEHEKMFLGNIMGEPPVDIALDEYETIRWIDDKTFLAHLNGRLYLGNLGGEEFLIAEGVSAFDSGT